MAQSENDHFRAFSFTADETSECVTCGKGFPNAGRSRRTTCSAECRRERGRRYSRQYYHDAMKIREDVLAMFGGRMPTGAEIVAKLKQRKSEQ